MNKLASFRKNPFLSINIARSRFGKFVFIHIQRTKSANNPAFAPIIQATELLYNSIFINLENTDKYKNLKLGSTHDVNKKIKEFKALTIKMESLVDVKFEKGSDSYLEFYPNGRTEYHRANKKNILVLFERILKVTTTYETELGSDWKNTFSQLYNDFFPLFEQQNKLKGAVSTTTSEFKELKKALCNQLYKNLLVILAEYYDNPVKAKFFFDESVVNWKKHKKKKKKVVKAIETTENKE
jgi:hypothetical protein